MPLLKPAFVIVHNRLSPIPSSAMHAVIPTRSNGILTSLTASKRCRAAHHRRLAFRLREQPETDALIKQTLTDRNEQSIRESEGVRTTPTLILWTCLGYFLITKQFFLKTGIWKFPIGQMGKPRQWSTPCLVSLPREQSRPDNKFHSHEVDFLSQTI